MKLRLSHIAETAVEPALKVLPKHLTSDKARVLLLAIGLQESRFEHRWQVLADGSKGPARGYWQFERGGVHGVYKHSASHEMLRLLCHDRDCSFDPQMIWAQLETDDVLAAGLARLLLWTDKMPLPEVGAAKDSWDYYVRNWRPGKPHRHSWDKLYARAMEEACAI